MLQILCVIILFSGCLNADVLPSWNETQAKKSIISFVETVTKEGEAYIPPGQRIATFDQDGTLWLEKPIYAQMYFALDRIRVLAKDHPEWQREQPFKAILENDHEKLQNLTPQEIEAMVAAAFSGMSVHDFHKQVADWLKTAVHPKFKKPFTELIYQPMLEVIRYLKDNQFKVYIVSGGGQDFIRAYAENVYGIPPEQIIGSTGKVKFEYQSGKPILLKTPHMLFIDDKTGKPESINLIIGRRPVAAFGNSVGDKEMLEWTAAGSLKHLELLVHHDDEVREYAYGENSKIGYFPAELLSQAQQSGWIVVSMKNDWKIIFPESNASEQNQDQNYN